MKVRVDSKLCTGASNCIAVAPTVFKLNGRKAKLLDPASVNEDKLWEAAESCPENAIILEDENGNQIYP